MLPAQRHLQPSHHGEQVPRGPTATPTSHQTRRLPQLHRLLQRGIRLDTAEALHQTLLALLALAVDTCTPEFRCCFLPAETPAPFAVNENTTELVVTAPLDREESERYRLLLVCTVRKEMTITKVETPLDVFVDDEDDNAPYVNGTDTADVIISFNRTMVRRFVSHSSDQF